MTDAKTEAVSKEDHDKVVSSLDEATATIAERDETIKDLKAELASTKKDLAAKPKGKVTERAAPKPRKAGPMAEGKSLSGEDLTKALADAEDVEIVFSDGKKEIDGVPAKVLEGEVWRDHALGKMVRDPVTIKGATLPTQLVGYALFIDGKQAAWTQRADPVNLAPGTTVELRDDIYF